MRCLINPDDFDLVPHPVWREIDSAAVPTHFDVFLDHFFAVDLKLHLVAGYLSSGPLIMVTFFSHLKSTPTKRVLLEHLQSGASI